MAKIYLFDVDGTLTPAKAKMNKIFATQFLKWMHFKNWVYSFIYDEEAY